MRAISPSAETPLAPTRRSNATNRIAEEKASEDRPHASPSAHYGEFVQRERRKANGQFGAKRTGISVMLNGLDQRSRVEAMSMIDVELVG
jgi:hypothetical protein